ncbi:hypothetical protein [Mycobacteroides abscessus]|uniref:hypothetical protein n=1 Tax=Mycobacteroides abscessus TaxID=36809 RepID=UPI00092CA561|nr:hypothetical protein [Mycobacteroides abscessus]SIE00997.1 transmembrane protein [Mycobacteroides abscessus subsp. abscessus]SKV07199.1 transmembrane protein [Mycobacteroides abscessus subsp. abscessus]
MAAIASVAIPTKSEIFGWPTDHLDQAAAQWEKAAEQSEQTFSQHVANISAPGGTDWTGKAATSAYDDAREAQDTVRVQASIYRECASIARRGAGDVRGAKDATVNAVEEAEGKGYAVAEDLRATDTRKGGTDSERATRKVEAQQLTEFMRWHARGLASTDARIAGELQAEAAGLQGRKLTKGSGDGTVHMLDDGDKSRNDRINDRDAKHPDGRDRSPDGTDGQRGRNDEIWRRSEGGNKGDNGNLNNDWAGRAILDRYLFGGGEEWDIDDDPAWSKYMMDNPELARQLDGHVRSQAQQALVDFQQGKGDYHGFGQRFGAEIRNGESITGWNYLHGTNSKVGDFQLGGTTMVQELENGNYKVTVHGRYMWNDIMDPNPQYSTDVSKARWGELISLGQAQDYTMRITWRADTEFILDKSGKPVEIKGYPYQ